MNFALLMPMGLAALAALLVPLLIHLARRSEERVVVFAALRWLQARPQPRRRRRFEEIPLLLLRLLLLTALALLLAQPVLFGQPDRRPWIAVAPGVDTAAARSSVGTGDARVHWLLPGFPALAADDRATDQSAASPGSATASAPDAASVPFASLLRELDATLPSGTSLTALVPPVLDGADAERPVLSRRVDWQVLPAAPLPRQTTAAPDPPQSAPTVMVRHDPARSAPLRYLRAAGIAWQAADTDAAGADVATGSSPELPSPISIAPADRALDPETHNLIWLVPGPLPDTVRDWITGGGTALLDVQTQMPEFTDDDDASAVVWRDDSGVLVRAIGLGRGRALRLQRELIPAEIPSLLEPDFPQQLQRLFSDAPPPPARVDAANYAPRTGASPYPEAPRPLTPWLVVLIAVLFVVERWIANGRRRRAAP